MSKSNGSATDMRAEAVQAVLTAQNRYDAAVGRGIGIPEAKAQYMNTLFNRRSEIIQVLEAGSEMRETIGSLQAALDEADGQIAELKAALQESGKPLPGSKTTTKRKPKEGGQCKDGVCKIRNAE